MKRVKLKHGSAMVEDNCSDKTINMLNHLTELAYEMGIDEINLEGHKLNKEVTCNHEWIDTHSGYCRDCVKCGRKE